MDDGEIRIVTHVYYRSKSKSHYYMIVSDYNAMQIFTGWDKYSGSIGFVSSILAFHDGDYVKCKSSAFDREYDKIEEKMRNHVLGINNTPEINEAKEALMEEIDRELKPLK